MSIAPPPSYHSQASYDARISIGDMSLHTVQPTTLTKPQQKRLQEMIRGLMKSTKSIKNDHSSDPWADGLTDDGGSFFTAKGTIRSLRPKVNDKGIEEDEEVDEEVLILVREPIKSTLSKKTNDGHEQEWSYGETPMPSRVLYLFHPPKGPSTNFLASSVNLIPWTWLESARDRLERAFWGILMPSVSGVVGVTEKVGHSFANIINVLPSPATLQLEGSVAWQTSTSVQHPEDPEPEIKNKSSTYSFSASASLRKEFQAKKHLYDQETLYTLRIPPRETGNGDDEIDIGPTAKPVHVRKRAAIPWDHDDARQDLGWGRNVNMPIGMRV
ncbi:uncharacterized protein I303_108319 [Kwoniella dejecticola CBS 10117]|uniref:Uncharacterized protein n=1 Tax=Kwoniella dejecticola CBS 10117 TaxID=1296121 RepID=A0A1A5ZXQ8_9TREE|nr:uncharacterized protein I303_07354 [Kwoniella dejecticola CBS 10117]OBR82592.1 hypothetical protein I303_07354 [Kwoniella dejecticola CBS 10117]